MAKQKQSDFKLEGELSYLVPFNEKHLNDPDYINWLRDYEVIKTINRLEYVDAPISFAEVKAYYESLEKSNKDIFYALYSKKDNNFIGTVRVSQIDRRARTAYLGILIGDRDYWGRGIASDSLLAVSKYMFDNHNMRKLSAGMMAINIGMIRTFEKLGFKKEGVFRNADAFEGGYCDHLYFGCFKDELKVDLFTK